MSATISAVKEFLKIPEGQRFVAGCLVVVITLAGVVVFQAHSITALNKAAVSSALDKAGIEKVHGTEIKQIQRTCDSTYSARLESEINDIKEQYRGIAAENNRLVKDALESATRQVSSQQRAIKNIQQVRQQLKK